MNLELFNRRLDELQAVICICGNEALLKVLLPEMDQFEIIITAIVLRLTALTGLL